MAEPTFRSAVPAGVVELDGVTLTDESSVEKWRVWSDVAGVPIGGSRRSGDTLTFCVSPGEWLVLGSRPDGVDAVDVTHVRAAIRVTGHGARRLLEQVCALDLSDAMTPNGAAARARIAGIATEIVRDDTADAPSYLLLVSRSFAKAFHHALTG